MNTIDLQALTDYLEKANAESVFLSFAEIEGIINSKMPDSYKKASWWHNTPERKHTLAWLSIGYMTENPKYNIQFRNGIMFRKFLPTKKNTLKNSRTYCFIRDAIIAIVISTIGSFVYSGIVSLITEGQQNKILDETVSSITNEYNSQHYDGLEEKILSITSKLEKKKKYLELCEVYEILFVIKHNAYVSLEQNLSDIQLSDIQNICSQYVNYAKICGNTYHLINSNNCMGSALLFQYEKTLDIKYANQASKYFEIAENTYRQYGSGLYPVFCYKSLESIEDIKIAEAGIESNELLFDLNYLLILNGEYSEDDLYKESILDLKDSTIMHGFMYEARVITETFYLINLVRESPYADQDLTNTIIDSFTVSSKAGCLYYILSQKYAGGLFNEETFSYEYAEKTLLELAELAQTTHNYTILASAYYGLVKLSFYKFLMDNDLESVEQFSQYYSLWQEITGKEDFSLAEFDKEYGGITRGVFLDLYIEEVNLLLSDMALEDNPSLFCYTQWDLGKHYYYKAQELIDQDAPTQDIKSSLMSTRRCCGLALLYYTKETNKRVYNEINKLLSDAEDTLLQLQ